MNRLCLTVAMLALVAVVAAPLLFLARSISLDQAKWALLLATLVWFVTIPLAMRRTGGAKAALWLLAFLGATTSLCGAGNCVAHAQSRNGVLTATRLRCEYLTDPLGVEVSEPRLSWIVESAASSWTAPAAGISRGWRAIGPYWRCDRATITW